MFEHLVSYRDWHFTLSDSRPPIRVAGQIVSWDLFALLGVQPQLGRGFLAQEEKPGTQVAVLSHALWMSRFGGDREILRRPIRVEGMLFTVVGVAPPGFCFPVDNPDAQLWTTLSVDSTSDGSQPISPAAWPAGIERAGAPEAGSDAGAGA